MSLRRLCPAVPMCVPMKNRLWALFCFALLICFNAANLQAQGSSATVNGLITDHSGAVVPNTEVQAVNIDTNVVYPTKTNGVGLYTIQSIPPGRYRIHIRRDGFKEIDMTDLVLHTQDTLQQNFSMEVGSTSESVTVMAGATNDNPAVSMTVSREFVENMPLNGRSFQDLIQLAPGTVSTPSPGNGYSIDGQRYDSNNFTVDGVSANLGGFVNNGTGTYGTTLAGSVPAQTALDTTQSIASIDSLQEFTIQTSGYAAEYGRSPGGQVQFTTRSGTNNLHGTLFEYLRNTAFDANSFSNDYYNDPQTAEHQNDFGGTLGGALNIPHLYDGKDKSFYFVSYEGLRLLLPSSEEEFNPTQAFMNAASPNARPFLQAAPPPNVLVGGAPVSGDSCKVSGTTILVSGGASNLPDCDDEFYSGYSYPEQLDNYSARFDENFGKRFRAFVRYADTPSFQRTGEEEQVPTAINTHSWTAGLTSTLSSTLLDEFRFNFTHDGEEKSEIGQPFEGAVPLARNELIPSAFDSPYAYGLAVIEPTNLELRIRPTIQNNATVQHQFQILNTISWTKGTHNLKFGADWRRLTPVFAVEPYGSSMTVRSVADIAQGNATTLVIQANVLGTPIFDNLSLYAQDHWRVSSRLSLDYGLRWDFNPPPGPSNGFYPVSLTSTNLTTASLSNDHTQPYQTDYHSFAPRIGFAWNAIPGRSHAVTVRGGFGIFFDTAQQAVGSEYADEYPFEATGPTQSAVPLPLSSSALNPPSVTSVLTTPYPSVTTSALNLTAPYTEQWNLSVDEALGLRNTFTASYVGNGGKKLLFTNYYNGIPGNPAFTTVYLTNNGANSNYNALQIQDLGRVTNGLDIVGSFTWAHALDSASTDETQISPVYGNSDNDVRRVLNLALNYHTPESYKAPWIQRIASGWALANRFSAQSGYPIKLYESTYITTNADTDIDYTPDLVPGTPIYLHGAAAAGSVTGWRLNRAAFACTTTGATAGACTGTPTREGTLGRNYVREPAFWTLNSSVQRDLPLYEQLHLIFRVDAFNIFNHPNLSGPNTTLSSAGFGELTGGIESIGSTNQLYAMGEPRSLQFSLKLQF